MAGNGGQHGRGAILVAVLLSSAFRAPPAVAAADDSTQSLPGITVTALTIDLDGDRSREIVRLVQEEENGTDYMVDAWEHDGTRWSMVGSAALPRVSEDRGAAIERGQAVSLLRSRIVGRDRVLVLSAAMVLGDQWGATCCLTVSELTFTAGGGLEVQPPQRLDGGAQSFWSADVDGDGSDELVSHESRYAATEEEQGATLRVLRWDGMAFDPVFEETDRQLLSGFTVADSDGVAGKDLLVGPGTDGGIRRLAWAENGMQLELAHIDAGVAQEGWIAGVADGAIVLSLGAEVRVVRWPRGQDATTVDQLRTLGAPGIGLIGDGAGALVVLQSSYGFESGRPPTALIHDLRLRRLGEVGVSAATAGFWEIANRHASGALGGILRNIFPYSGPTYGGFGEGRPAYLSSGMLIEPGGPQGYVARPVASMVGVQPIGTAGPRDAWVVLGSGYSPPSGIAYLSWGGIPIEWGRLTVTPVEKLLQPDGEVETASIELLGAVEVARDGDEATLVAEGEGFQVAVAAPPGSAVIVVNGILADDHTVADEPLRVDILPPQNRAGDENQAFEAMILVISPDGRGLAQRWVGTFVRELPEISVTASTDSMALSATLMGRATAGSVVDAGGRAIETDDDGRFEASIDAPIWPSRVLVTARDPLGNESTQVVEVVGVVDYRGLPWAAFLVAATIVVGGVLYVRTPKRRGEPAIAGGDGRLEELELDVVEGGEPGRR